MSDHIFFKEHGDVSQVLRAAEDVIDACGGNRARSRRKNIVHDCQIVNGEVPDHINISLEKTEIDSGRIVIKDVSQFSGISNLFDLAYGARVYERVVHHKHKI